MQEKAVSSFVGEPYVTIIHDQSNLGWEDFQIQDLLAIKHILVLCYFIGAYFCELEAEIIDNEFMQIICKLGGGKGKISLHFFLSGIKKMYHYEQTKAFFEEKELSKEDIAKLLKFTNWDYAVN